MLEKLDIRQFMKRKSVSENLSVENISDQRLRIEVQPVGYRLMGRQGKAFC